MKSEFLLVRKQNFLYWITLSCDSGFRFGKLTLPEETEALATLAAGQTKYQSTKGGETVASFSQNKSNYNFVSNSHHNSDMRGEFFLLYLKHISGNYNLHFQKGSHIICQTSWCWFIMQLYCLLKMHHEQSTISFLESSYPFHAEKISENSKHQHRDWE